MSQRERTIRNRPLVYSVDTPGGGDFFTRVKVQHTDQADLGGGSRGNMMGGCTMRPQGQRRPSPLFENAASDIIH